MPFPGNMEVSKSGVNSDGRAVEDISSSPMQFDFGKRKEEYLAEHRRIYRTMVRKPRVPLELYIQMRKYADLNDIIVGSDIIRYKDILFCCETNNVIRKKAGMLYNSYWRM